MKAAISVFVICKNETYLTRCLNAIKRQSLKPIEIVLISDGSVENEVVKDLENVSVYDEVGENIYRKVNQALLAAKGEYILLCSNTSNMTDNLLETLGNVTLSEDISIAQTLPSATLYVPNSNGYEKCDAYLSVYGKLFSKTVIKDAGLSFDEASSIGEYCFLDAYLKKTRGITVCENAGIYESSTASFDMFGYKHVLEAGTDDDWITLQMRNARGTKTSVVAKCKSVVAGASKASTGMVVLQNVWPEPPQELIDRLVEERVMIRVEEERSHLEPIIQTQTVVQERIRELTGYEFASQMSDRAAKGEIGLKSIFKCLGAWFKSKFGRGSKA